MKTPPQQYTDSEARKLTERFIKKYGAVSKKESQPRKKRKK